ncbi:DHH family phosphoesterase [Spiroplasma endosymbiont of Megaselia nigra]|uniref:DHH family phosphoesterase n=1 Tax=Spiroplasma endosymbiont of Megaselia nigra TaxID=2478537 RepID=UPI000F87FDF5|nr:bifunctional oligoribonuclease/PAP phosphatase NrnA [Spiroplasma endosymbiont of Megaselia nigra]RUO86303.1 bifunctional oligoribonuclease/PAP phosphatase NrnA [Spiroplasma endosymbiont of Megaselia nigra]
MQYLKGIILQKIKDYKTIICLRHISPDGDAYGSAFGLAQFIKDNFPNKRVLVDGAPNDFLAFLATPDLIQAEDYKDALVIVTDTANIERIDSKYWQKAKEVIKIDHHPNVTPFGDIQWIDETKIAVSEMIAELVLTSKLIVTPEAAKLIFTGIVTDSNRFMYSKTFHNTFMLAGQLVATGFDLQSIYQNLYEESWVNVRFKNYLLSQVVIYDKEISYVKITDEMLKEHNMSYETVKPWVNIMSNIKEFKIWMLVIENKAEGYINLSIRSNTYIINKVAEKYCGGGHQLASGAKIYQWEDLERVLKDLSFVIKNNIKYMGG